MTTTTPTTYHLTITYHDLHDAAGLKAEVLAADKLTARCDTRREALIVASRQAAQVAYLNDCAFVIRDADGQALMGFSPICDPGYRKWLDGTGCQECDGAGCTECDPDHDEAADEIAYYVTYTDGHNVMLTATPDNIDWLAADHYTADVLTIDQA